MKSLLFIFLGFFSWVIPLHAQISNLQIEDSKQLDKGLTIELTASPFNSNYPLLAPGFLRARFFSSEYTSFRLGLWARVADHQVAPESVENTWLVSVRPGFEYRFEGSGKTTPYAAIDGVLDLQMSKYESTISPSVSGALDINGRDRSYWQAGLYLAAGVDYLISDHFYLGMELGFQYAYRRNAEISVGGNITETSTTANRFDTIFANTLRVGFKLF